MGFGFIMFLYLMRNLNIVNGHILILRLISLFCDSLGRLLVVMTGCCCSLLVYCDNFLLYVICYCLKVFQILFISFFIVYLFIRKLLIFMSLYFSYL